MTTKKLVIFEESCKKGNEIMHEESESGDYIERKCEVQELKGFIRIIQGNKTTYYTDGVFVEKKK